MRSGSMHAKHLIALVPALFLALTGCAHWKAPDTPAAREGQRVLEQLRAVNSGLEAVKGLGQAALTTGTGRQRVRVAWAAQATGQLRMELLAVSGHPLATLATDGEYLYLRDNAGDRFLKCRAPRANLKALVQVPLRVPDLIDLLMGRIPLPKAEHSVLMDNPRQSGYILERHRWWGTKVQQIHLAADGLTVRRVVFFDADGHTTHWATLSGHKDQGGYTFPGQLAVAAPTGARMEIRMERLWPGARLNGEAFQLSD